MIKISDSTKLLFKTVALLMIVLPISGIFLYKEIERLGIRNDQHPIMVYVKDKWEPQTIRRRRFWNRRHYLELSYRERYMGELTKRMSVTPSQYARVNVGDSLLMITDLEHTIFCFHDDIDVRYENIVFPAMLVSGVLLTAMLDYRNLKKNRFL